MDGDDKKSLIKVLLFASSLGFQIVISILLGLFFGLYLDKKFRTKPVFTLIFLALGIAAAYKNMYYVIKERKEDDREE